MNMDKQAKRIIAWGALVLLCFLLYFLNPEDFTLYRCPVYYWTGIKCPGCGALRAMHHYMRMDFETAFRYNMLLPFFVLFIAADFLIMRKGSGKLRRFFTGNLFIGFVLAVLLSWMILRNILGV